ncbi:hypothetical protein LZP69_10470 [Shewanella sp. AS1]|uniref:hypothetical protein n=1 Tax=Shewanella sp. AS1 TaxID=2907626 RepID=UPI001F3A4324|nr:hypothetical protein [Shewanella sp. AS1]MCE9679583.1 hypothetical protein [Shewanella sp. AS1]
MNTTRIPSKELIEKVRAGFVSQGRSLHQWCRENEVNYSNARQALMGVWAGKKGTELLNKIADAAGV